ncbi:MAG TPA: hypothetical protein VHW09_31705 [Bryobacteraceae bacterium]|jgi:NADPH-dependent 2,4-dienoyl-CoA reductase/sulfur reductase-like enzyme|nr:hypothetical protein [Bryobacteraceae bacterium]
MDDRMETNLRGVYAAGDCAEVSHVVTGKPTWIPLGTTANKTGRIAGADAAGGRERFVGIAGTSIMRVFDAAFATTGLTAAQARAEGFSPWRCRSKLSRGMRTLAVRKPTSNWSPTAARASCSADRSSGEDGAAGRINVIATALQTGMRVDQFEQLDLAYSPPYATVWDPLLIAAQQLMKDL